jgi:hypothetical protein
MRTLIEHRTRRAAYAALFTLSALAAAALGSPAASQPTGWDRQPAAFEWQADGRLVDVSILVDGSYTRLYRRPGTWDRQYLEAIMGGRYSLVIRNNTGERVGVAISVDGLNVVNGERARLNGREPMYVLDAYESATIRGWRTSLDEVRQFVFVDEQRSYAERTGQANADMGWIRVHAFREQRPLAWNGPKVKEEDRASERERRQDNEAAPPAAGSPAPEGKGQLGAEKQSGRDMAGLRQEESNPGTGWGSSQYDPVQRTVFVAASRPTDKLTLRYEYASGLVALGIDPYRERPRHRTWDREQGLYGFAKPPRD